MHADGPFNLAMDKMVKFIVDIGCGVLCWVACKICSPLPFRQLCEGSPCRLALPANFASFALTKNCYLVRATLAKKGPCRALLPHAFGRVRPGVLRPVLM